MLSESKQKLREQEEIDRVIDYLESNRENIELIEVESTRYGGESDRSFKIDMGTKLEKPVIAKDPTSGFHYEVH